MKEKDGECFICAYEGMIFYDEEFDNWYCCFCYRAWHFVCYCYNVLLLLLLPSIYARI